MEKVGNLAKRGEVVEISPFVGLDLLVHGGHVFAGDLAEDVDGDLRLDEGRIR